MIMQETVVRNQKKTVTLPKTIITYFSFLLKSLTNFPIKEKMKFFTFQSLRPTRTVTAHVSMYSHVCVGMGHWAATEHNAASFTIFITCLSEKIYPIKKDYSSSPSPVINGYH